MNIATECIVLNTLSRDLRDSLKSNDIDRVKWLGSALNTMGGLPLMQFVCSALEKDRTLFLRCQVEWNGIGEWLY